MRFWSLEFFYYLTENVNCTLNTGPCFKFFVYIYGIIKASRFNLRRSGQVIFFLISFCMVHFADLSCGKNNNKWNTEKKDFKYEKVPFGFEKEMKKAFLTLFSEICWNLRWTTVWHQDLYKRNWSNWSPTMILLKTNFQQWTYSVNFSNLLWSQTSLLSHW